MAACTRKYGVGLTSVTDGGESVAQLSRCQNPKPYWNCEQMRGHVLPQPPVDHPEISER